ncbi:MAG: GNAT family N-acetyltransferase [Salinivirgaceae bacterium]|nr:GNAT family N-acetyltransferase [Salinivirgaceae bacterium]
MENIIEAVDIKLLEKELTKDKFVRKTNFGNNEIYIFSHHDSPFLMDEIGRLREITFRAAGGGTGKAKDVDDYDLADKPYKQLIVWSPEEKAILGGYRFIVCRNAPKDKEGNPILATSRLFHYSENFKENYLPNLIELGRSFVVPNQQASQGSRRGLFTLDGLWDGLGALIVDNPEVKYFFGKVTMYRHYNIEARNALLYFIHKYFGGNDELIKLINPLHLEIDSEKLSKIFVGASYEENYKILSKKVRELGENIPPLINAYMNLSPSMKVFGTSINPYFGDVEETGILLTIKDIYKTKSHRHIETYLNK